jgi:hypothetical protein
MKDKVCMRHFHCKSFARSFLEQAKACRQRQNLSQKDIQERGLILEVIVGGSWCVSRHLVGTIVLH